LAESEHNYSGLWDKKKITDMNFWFLKPPPSAERISPATEVMPLMNGGTTSETRHEQVIWMSGFVQVLKNHDVRESP
jgi:hypothetical protein